MTLIVQKSGILDTIQDLGRYGFAKYGINSNGAMDRTAVRLLNALLANEEGEAVIECHFPAGEFLFENDCIVAVGGADFAAHIDDKSIDNWRPYIMRNGSVLRFPHHRFGGRAYVAVKKGFEIEMWLGSQSTNLTAGRGGFGGRKLMKGDSIGIHESSTANLRSLRVSARLIPIYSRFPTVRAIPGPEFDHLDQASQERLFSANFEISIESNRMGYRLIGDKLFLRERREYISGGVTFGTVQLLPDGQLVVLMADHQTSGGYPRIANVIDSDLPLLAQISSHDKVAFRSTTMGSAEKLSRELARDLRRLRIGARLTDSKG